MTNPYQRVIHAIRTAPDPIALQDVQNLLPAYVEAELAGKDAQGLYPQIAAAVAADPDLQEAYEDLRMLLVLQDVQEWVEPKQSATRDLAFLRSVWTESEDGVRRLVRAVTLRMEQAKMVWVDMGALFALYHQTIPTGVVRSSTEEQQEAWTEVLELPDHDANVLLQLFKGLVQEGTGTVRIGLRTLDSATALAGARLILQSQTGKILERQYTDSSGIFEFRDLLSGDYLLHIRYEGKEWVIPLAFIQSP